MFDFSFLRIFMGFETLDRPVNRIKPETKRYFTKTTNPEAYEEFQAMKTESEANSKTSRSGRSKKSCQCGDRANCDFMIERTVGKGGPNHGRRFYSCQECNYFQWL